MVCYTSLAGVHLPEGAPEMFNNSGLCVARVVFRHSMLWVVTLQPAGPAWPHLAYGPPALMRTILTMSLVDPARHGGHHWITSVLLFLLRGLLIFRRFSTSCLQLCVRWLLKHLMMWSRIWSRSWTKMNVWPWPEKNRLHRENKCQEKTAWRVETGMSRRCQEKGVQRARDVKKNEKEMSRATDNKRKGMKRMSRDAK